MVPRLRWSVVARRTAGLASGAATALVELWVLAVIGLALLPVPAWGRQRRAVLRPAGRVAVRLTTIERRRLRRWLDVDAAPPATSRAALAFLTARCAVGLLAGAIFALLAGGLATAVIMLGAWLLDEPAADGGDTGLTVLSLIIPGVVLLYLALQGLVGVVGLERWVAARFLGPNRTEALERRIEQLAESRAGVVAAVDAERRRIERDLHDGVQQQLVALGLLLGRARRASDPARGQELLRAAHEESQRVLADLRAVAWRVYPTALDTLGLEEALTAVAEGVGASLEFAVDEPPPDAVATAVYFVVAEAATNAVKHAGTGRVRIEVRRDGDRLRVRVDDDGAGGADPDGGGLSGLRRRVAALDGRFAVTSPAGGPTVVVAELPCG
ncbi:sensor histidine kinase [Jiangella asiatica]|uniref:histidine kinase n=1 Tax=Jiangella asiatica TaxID=2530372 RepID=A0A4R5DJU5_9ACTN|nr:histidine kinase [Jiangella asiatica]TDE12234.1 sensor histidine kinase [Jiangella asiatica]